MNFASHSLGLVSHSAVLCASDVSAEMSKSCECASHGSFPKGRLIIQARCLNWVDFELSIFEVVAKRPGVGLSQKAFKFHVHSKSGTEILSIGFAKRPNQGIPIFSPGFSAVVAVTMIKAWLLCHSIPPIVLTNTPWCFRTYRTSCRCRCAPA